MLACLPSLQTSLRSPDQRHAKDSQSTSRPTSAAAEASGIPPQYQHLPKRAVKTALKLIDRLISQAVKTAEVNMVIRAAEAKEEEEEGQQGVDVMLDEEGWQDTVR